MGSPDMAALVQHNFWRHRWLIYLALSGAVISLSNVFSFPLAIGDQGGAFLVAYLAAHLVIAVPVIMAELLVGRRGRHSVPHSLAHLSAEAFVSQRWRYLGVVIVVSGTLIASYYLAFSSWALEYLWRLSQNTLPDDASGLRFVLAELLASPGQMIALHTVMCVTVFLCLALPSQWGVQMPVALMAVVLIAGVGLLAFWSGQQGYWADGVNQLFDIQPGTISLEVWVRAAALSFYSLGLGLGISLILGAHMDDRLSIGSLAFSVVMVDILWSMIFASALLGIVTVGDGMDAIDFIFIELPLQLLALEQGSTMVLVLFGLLLLSGLSTGLFLVKNAVMWLHERYAFSRLLASAVAMSAVWTLGVAVVLSFNVWREVRFYGATILEWVSTIPGNLVLPALCLLLVTYVGWVLPARYSIDEIKPTHEHRYHWWHFTIKFVTTLALLSVLLVQVESVWLVDWWLQVLLLLAMVAVGLGFYRYRHWYWESS